MTPTRDEIESLVAALQHPYDRHQADLDIERLDIEPEIRIDLIKTFLDTEHGMRVFGFLAHLFHWDNTEISSEREKHLRNGWAKVLYMMGYFRNPDVTTQLLGAARYALAVDAQNELTAKHAAAAAPQEPEDGPRAPDQP